MLEVLKELKEACATHMGRMVYILQEDKFEAIEKAFDSLSKDHEKAMKELSKEIEKNRALEIIKKKKVNLVIFLGCDTLEEYNKHPLSCWKLTEEEYDLLKEVLL